MTAAWRIPGSPWWWTSALEATPPGMAAQQSFVRQLRLAQVDAAVRARPWWTVER